jgi:hypothetical protein
MSRLTTLVVAVAVVLIAAWHGQAAPNQATKTTPAANTGEQVVVLDHYSTWRTYAMMKPPVIQFDAGPKPVLSNLTEWINHDTAAAPANWAKPDFDDSSWYRGTVYMFPKTPYLARLYQRARFEVADLAQVQNLKLTLNYYGGAIVYVNGQEVARGNLAKASATDLAEGYAAEQFVSADGKIMTGDGTAESNYKARIRTLADVLIPAKFLHQGVNVVALEIVRAPYNKILDEKKADVVKDKKAIAERGTPYTLTWNTCETRGVVLTATGGVTPNAVPSKEMQVWNGDILTEDYESDFGDPGEPLRPVVIKGAINGWYSAKVVVGSTRPIRGLQATVTDLRQGGSTIPASALRTRYAVSRPEGPGDGRYSHPYVTMITDMLLESPLETFPLGRQNRAVVPIWVTVKVPANAKPGIYAGQMSIAVRGEKTVTVPLRLELADFTVPNREDYRSWVELIQSPDTLALEYNVPLWSDKHWALMEQSMRYIGEMGTRSAYVPLIAHTNFGNAESMVRWIKKSDGTYDYDFSIMDKYLDLVQKYIVQPKIVAFNVWEVYLHTGDKEPPAITEADKKDPWLFTEKNAVVSRWNLGHKGPAVTALDPATGKTETINLPRFEDPAAKAVWKPLFDELHKRMAKRGLEGAMHLAMAPDIWPEKQEVATIQEVSGNLPWVSHTHGGSNVGTKLQGLAPLDYFAFVWNNVVATEPSKGRMYGWKRPELMTLYERFYGLNSSSLPGMLHAVELNITGQQRGIGRIGADFWAPIKNAKGQRVSHAVDRYPESYWHSLNLASHMLAPGPDGPVALQRYEILREGIQECEARIAIENVLTDEALKAKLGPALAKKSQDVLDARLWALWRCGSTLALQGGYGWQYATAPLPGSECYGVDTGTTWFIGSGWQDRTQQFYALAGEVVKKTSAK